MNEDMNNGMGCGCDCEMCKQGNHDQCMTGMCTVKKTEDEEQEDM